MSGKNKKYSVFKAISWYAAGNIFVKSISFFVLPLLTNLMSTKDYGIYTALISNSTIIESIMIFGLAPTVRIAKFDEDTDYNSYTSSILFIPVFIFFVFSIAINTILIFNHEFLSLDRTIWNWALVYCLTNVEGIILANRLVLDGKYKVHFVYLLINVLSSISLFFILANSVFANNTYLARICGQIVGNVLSVLFMLWAIGFNGLEKKYLIKGIVWGLPLVVHSFTISLFNQMDTQLINAFSEFAELGIYGMATTIGLIPATIEASFESAWSPWFFNKMNSEKSEVIRRQNDLYFFIYAAIIIEFMLVTPEILLFINKSYRSCIYYLLPITINFYIELIYLVPLNVQYYYKNTKNVMVATVIATAVEAVMIILFIKKFGFYGAVYAKTISKILLVMIHYHFAKKLDNNDYFGKKNFLGMLAVMYLINYFVIVFMNNMIIRAAMFAAIGVFFLCFVFYKRKEILELFNG